MQHAAALELQVRDVLIVRVKNREARQDRIAVVAVVVDHVPAVGGLPDVLGEKFVLRRGRPVVVAVRMAEVQPLYFLQEDDVRRQMAQPLTQFMDHHATVELRETLVNVVGGDVQLHGGALCRQVPADAETDHRLTSLRAYCSMNVSYSRRLSWRDSMTRPVHRVMSTASVKP